MRMFKLKKIISLLLVLMFAISAVMPSFAEQYDDLNEGIVIIKDDISMDVALRRFNAVRNRFYTNTEVADKVTMIGDSSTTYVFNTPSYALLAARMLKALANGETDMRITYEYVPYRENGYSKDTFKAPMVSKKMYLDMAEQVLAYYAKNGRGDFDVLTYPNKNIAEYSGNICMYRAAGIMSWALAYYYKNGVLPKYITTAYKRNERTAIELKEESFYVLDYATDYLKNVAGGTTIAKLLTNFANDDLYVADETGKKVSDTSAVVRTGWCVCRENDETILDSIVMIVNGDINRDGYGDDKDRDIIIDAVLNGTNYNGIEKDVIDVDLNKKINIWDLLSFQRAVNSIKNKTVTYNSTAAENAFDFIMSKRTVQSGEEFTMKIYASKSFKARLIGALDFSVRIDPERVEIVSWTMPEKRSGNTASAHSYSDETKEFRMIWADASDPINKIDYLMEITFKAKQDISEIWPATDMPVYFVSNKSFMTDIYGNEFQFRAAKRCVDEFTEEVIEIPAPDAVLTLEYAVDTFAKAGKNFEKTGVLPETIAFNDTIANKASYFRLACEVLDNLIDMNEDDVPYYVCTEPEDVERRTMSDDTMSKTAYSYIVKRQLDAMNTLVDNKYANVPAAFIAISQNYGINGSMDYERTLITFMRIFSYYHDFGVLPENIDIAWEDKVYTLADDIIDAAKTVIDYFDENFEMPNSIVVGGETLNMSQYFDVAAKMTAQINATGVAHRVILQDCTALDWVASDDFTIDNADNTISKNGYLYLVNTQMAAMDAYLRRQPLISITFEDDDEFSGSINFDHQILILSRVLRSYRKTGILPEAVSADYEQPTTVYEIPTMAALVACSTLYETYDKDPYAALPSSKTVTFTDENGEEVTFILKQATYARMAAELLITLGWDDVYQHLPEKIYVPDVKNPVNNVRDDTYAEEEIEKKDYMKLAKAYAAYAQGHANKAPSLMRIDGIEGSMCFDRITVIMLRVLNDYAIRHKLTNEVYTDFKADIEPTPTAEATVEPTIEATKTPLPTVDATQAPTEIKIKENSTYTKDAEGKLLLGVAENTTLQSLLAAFEDEKHIKVFDENDKEVVDGEAVIGTGYTVKLIVDVTLKEELSIVVVGDMNGDGKVNSRDIARIQKILMGASETNELQQVAADINGDVKLNSRDIASLQRKLLA